MATAYDLTSLRLDDQHRILELTARFEEALTTKEPIDVEAFLPPPDSPLRLPALVVLIEKDLEEQARKGHASLTDYLERFPELGDARTLPVTLIYAEYR